MIIQIIALVLRVLPTAEGHDLPTFVLIKRSADHHRLTDVRKPRHEIFEGDHIQQRENVSMINMSEKLRCFFVRSARDVASQALPNWAQISISLAKNFYEVFIACTDEEQQALLEGARSVSTSEWASIRGQVASELGERYAEALDQARTAHF